MDFEYDDRFVEFYTYDKSGAIIKIGGYTPSLWVDDGIALVPAYRGKILRARVNGEDIALYGMISDDGGIRMFTNPAGDENKLAALAAYPEASLSELIENFAGAASRHRA